MNYFISILAIVDIYFLNPEQIRSKKVLKGAVLCYRKAQKEPKDEHKGRANT